MPFTPFHMGPAVTLKLLGLKYFSFTIFGYSQILMDLEPLFRLLRGDDIIHGYSHTYVGAILIGLITIATGKWLCEFGLRVWNEIFVFKFLQVPTQISWSTAIISTYIGVFSHVLLDSVMHSDMRPWAPFSEVNGALHYISVGQLHQFCLILGAIGAVGLLVVWVWRISRP